MNQELNAICKVCGTPYHRCDSCDEKKGLIHYKYFVDTPECFKIFATITSKESDEEKRAYLSRCDLKSYPPFLPEIQAEINRLLKPKKKVKLDKVENPVASESEPLIVIVEDAE